MLSGYACPVIVRILLLCRLANPEQCASGRVVQECTDGVCLHLASDYACHVIARILIFCRLANPEQCASGRVVQECKEGVCLHLVPTAL